MTNQMSLRELSVYILFVIMMLGLSLWSLRLDAGAVGLLLKEGGVIETASAAGYFVCIVLLYFLGRMRSLRTHWFLYVMFLAMALRELDFDKRFTEVGVLKSKFLITDDVSLLAKTLGAVILFLLISAIVVWLKRHASSFFRGIIELKSSSFAVGFALSLMVVSKSIDGFARKLAPLGIYVSERADQIASHFEEVFELGIPITFLYAIYLYWQSQDSSKNIT